ncbi:hypothetical protein B0H11DRAFT_1926064 [Mycena galericulata]|nr:hypothetical protein B0H11DRAFT_1926064 [Mycena galericulata]
MTETNSATPAPLWCDICGEQNLDGDDDPNEVQCENCRYWSHIKCQARGINWRSKEVHFICQRCRIANPLIEILTPDKIIMVPDPNAPDWKAPDVLWYPARFIQHHLNNVRTSKEYEFQWLECTDGVVFHSGDSDLPRLMQRMFFRGRKFCLEILDVELVAKKLGKVRLPLYMKPDYPGHENPALAAIFKAAIPGVAKILAAFDDGHPVTASYTKYFRGKKNVARQRNAGDWMATFALVPTAELEAVIADPLLRLLKHKSLADLPQPDRHERVMGVGSALLQLLAVQHELGEPLNLNGDTMHDLVSGAIVPLRYDGDDALNYMFAALPLRSNESGEITGHLLKFKGEHSIYDADLRPPTFCREFRSHTDPSEAISVVLKRQRDAVEEEDEPPAKRRKRKQPESAVIDEPKAKKPAKAQAKVARKAAEPREKQKIEGRQLRSSRKR